MSWDDDLRGPAFDIAACKDNSLRVIAGPGTGKTFALKRRVARLLEEGVSPRKILVVTFTRVAAFDLIHELNNLNIIGCDQIQAGTFHSFCFSILYNQEVFSHLSRNPRILYCYIKSKVLKFEAAPLINDIMHQGKFGTKRNCSKRLRAFESAWARLQSDEPGWPIEDTDRLFQDRLLEWLTFHQAILLGELIPLTLKFLRNNPASPVLANFNHIIVDEYQDLNKAEQVLIDFLKNSNCNISIVGDGDQSIYSFKFAYPSGIEGFSKTHVPTHDETLIECRRCPQIVVKIANYFIRHNQSGAFTNRITPKDDNPEGEISIVQFNLLEEETDGISSFVNYLIKNRNYSPNDILILSPRSKIGHDIKTKLLNQSIPAHSFYNEEVLHSEEAQEAMTILALFNNKNDRVSLRWFLGCKSNTWLYKQYSNLKNYSMENSLSPIEVLEKCQNEQIVDLSIPKLIDRYNILRNHLSVMEKLDLSELIDYLFPDDEYTGELRILAFSILDNVTSPKDLYKELLLNLFQPEIPTEGDYVRIMSLHKSKGLTSKVVIISGCMHGLIPFFNKDHSDFEKIENLKEQRRLFYVGITRCKEILLLSSTRLLKRDFAHQIGATVKGGSGAYGQTIMSNFINELGPNAPKPVLGLDWIANNFI